MNTQFEDRWFLRVFDSGGSSVTPEPDDRTPMNFMFTPMPRGEYMLTAGQHGDNLFRGHRGGADHGALSSTQSSYTPVTVEGLGDMRFLRWTTEGYDGEITTVTKEIPLALNDCVRFIPVFGNVVFKMDHFDMSGMKDASGLETMAYFTYGNSYPDPDELKYYVFDGWMVDSMRYATENRIETHINHTAVSPWRPTVLHMLMYTWGRWRNR